MDVLLSSAGVDVTSADGAVRLRAGWWAAALLEPEPEPEHAQFARPGWIAAVERAVAVAVPPDEVPSAGSWQQAFAVPLRPFVTVARDRLVNGLEVSLPTAYADPRLIGDGFAAALEPRLARIAVRTMISELAAARDGGRLTGSDGRQRFKEFLRGLCAPTGLAALVEEYPVLARLLGTASLQAAEADLELLTRFAADRAAIVQTVLNGADPGPIEAIEPGLGDRHQRGRSVTAISFADGSNLIYKPRDMAIYVRFEAIVEWLNRRVAGSDLRLARVLARPGYGWQEFIAGRPLGRPEDAERFYRRLGVLLAVLYPLRATDMHFENLIAAGDQPVLIDVETLLHPTLQVTNAIDPAASALTGSVYRTALLPCAVAGQVGVFDQSGMGGDVGDSWPDPVLDWDPPATDTAGLIWRTERFAGGANRPHCDHQTMEPADYESVVVEGFRLGYDAIATGRPEFTGLVEACGDAEVRVVIRPTRNYARMLDESTRPDLLRDARARQAVLEGALAAPVRFPPPGNLDQREFADLWTGDVPLVTARPGGRDVWTSAGRRLPDLLNETPLNCALDTIAAMGAADRQEQEWVISASFATRRPAGDHRNSAPAPGPVTFTAADTPAADTPAEPARLLTAACELADEIMARGRTDRDAAGQLRVNWPGLQLVDEVRWLLLPMGASLADGYLGVALFLAQLGVLTGIGRYVEEARRAVRPVPTLLNLLADRSDLLAAIGCGGIDGFGGISYGLARMASLLDDADIRQWARTAIQVTARSASLRRTPGWAAGTGGCLAAMMAVRTELKSADAAAVARMCADDLIELVERTDGRCALNGDLAAPGFAVGPAGIGWALARFAAPEQDVRCSEAARRAVLRAGEPVDSAGGETRYGWCSGIAGRLIARLGLPDDAGDDDGDGIDCAVLTLADRPLLSDLSLCHGELGITDALAVVAASGQSATVHDALRHRAELVLNAVERRAWYCGTPGGVSTPGLVNGLAGIGYGLLRLGFPDRVPSLLLLEPTPW